ncbi:MAG: hypothetical protein LBQ73_05105 [Tannerellaceae bacterium]|nr:hypothetical protein [Tannerellaceae bacterium]
METNFNEQDSLRLITEMITQARSNFQRKNGRSILLWGYAIAILALSNFALLHLLEGEAQMQSYWVWMLTIPLFIVNYIYEARKAKRALVKNHIDRMIGYLWLAFFVANLIFIASVFALTLGFHTPHIGVLYLLIMPVTTTLTGLCLFVNGQLCRFRPYVYGGIIFWVGALLSVVVLLVWLEQSLQFLVLSLCTIGGFIIPGHLLNEKEKQDV